MSRLIPGDGECRSGSRPFLVLRVLLRMLSGMLTWVIFMNSLELDTEIPGT